MNHDKTAPPNVNTADAPSDEMAPHAPSDTANVPSDAASTPETPTATGTENVRNASNSSSSGEASRVKRGPYHHPTGEQRMTVMAAAIAGDNIRQAAARAGMPRQTAGLMISQARKAGLLVSDLLAMARKRAKKFVKMIDAPAAITDRESRRIQRDQARGVPIDAATFRAQSDHLRSLSQSYNALMRAEALQQQQAGQQVIVLVQQSGGGQDETELDWVARAVIQHARDTGGQVIDGTSREVER